MTLAGVSRPEPAGTKRSTSFLADIIPSSPLTERLFVLHQQSDTSGQQSFRPATLAYPPLPSDASDSRHGLDGAQPLSRDDTTQHTSNQMTALVDFFTNHPPPPDNFMSTPHGAGGGDRGWGPWSKFRRMGKRSKSLPRTPKQIRLPDSAVSGTTIGGHRHIAISIPLEVTPFAEVPRTQYPVYSPRDAAKGKVKLLHPRSGTSQAPTSPDVDDRLLPPSQWIRPGALHHRSKGVTREKPYDYIGILPAQLDTTVLNDSSAPWNSSPSSDEGLGYYRLSRSSPQQSSLPARSSSAVRLRGKGQHASIDSLLSQQQRQRWRQQQRRSQDITHRLQGPSPLSPGGSNSLSKASVTSASSSEWGKPRKSSTILGLSNERPAAPKRQDARASGLTVIADSPIVAHRDPSPPPAPAPTLPRSRREAVRDRKLRDMEAVRRSKQMERDNTTSDIQTITRTSKVQVIKETVQGCVSETCGLAAKNNENGPRQHLSLSTMVVVANFEPSSSGQPAKRHLTPPVPQSVGQGSDAPEQLSQLSEPSIPTPPMSARGSPPATRVAADRTSLTRRREWKAIREQERKAREAIALARAEAQGLAPGSVTSDDKGSPADRELMCLYEAYREHRLRDMERRLRRLERNGDVWLRALVPVLDNLNRTLVAANRGELSYRDEHGDSATDDEAGNAAKRLGLDADRRSRRRSLAQGRLSEKLARQRASVSRGNEDDDDDDDDDYNKGHRNGNGVWRDSASGSDDTSGLGSIEPLMRELAGEARKRQRAAARAQSRKDEVAQELRGVAGRGVSE